MEHKQITKGQHYISQFYLKEFEDSNGLLWVYDYMQNKQYTTSTERFGKQNYLYETEFEGANPQYCRFIFPNQIENQFSLQEDHYTDWLGHIKHRCFLNQRPDALILNKIEKRTLYSLMVNLYLRHPLIMKQLMVDKVPENLDSIPEIPVLTEISEKLGYGHIEPLIKAFQKRKTLTEFDHDSLPESCINDLLGTDIHFFHAGDENFITSSLPVLLCEDKEIENSNQKSGIFVLTPKIAVTIGNEPAYRIMRNRMRVASPVYVDYLNKCIASWSKDFGVHIIAQSKELISRYSPQDS